MRGGRLHRRPMFFGPPARLSPQPGQIDDTIMKRDRLRRFAVPLTQPGETPHEMRTLGSTKPRFRTCGYNSLALTAS